MKQCAIGGHRYSFSLVSTTLVREVSRPARVPVIVLPLIDAVYVVVGKMDGVTVGAMVSVTAERRVTVPVTVTYQKP